jgi:hypothetical protein
VEDQPPAGVVVSSASCRLLNRGEQRLLTETPAVCQDSAWNRWGLPPAGGSGLAYEVGHLPGSVTG